MHIYGIYTYVRHRYKSPRAFILLANWGYLPVTIPHVSFENPHLALPNEFF